MVDLLKRDIIRKPPIWARNPFLFDFVVHTAEVLAAALGRSLLPVGAGTRLVDDVDFVPITGRGLNLVVTTFREERDVHRFVDGTLRAWLEIILWVWVIVDDQPVADVARPATVRSDGFRRTLESLLEEIFDRMSLRPEVVNFAALAMVLGAARDCTPGPDAPGTECGHHVNHYARDDFVLVRVEDPETGTPVSGRHRLPPLDVVTPTVAHRFIRSISNGYAVNLGNIRSRLDSLAFEQPENGVAQVLVCWMLRRPSDLIVLFCNSFRFLKDSGQIRVTHNSWRQDGASAPRRAQIDLTNEEH